MEVLMKAQITLLSCLVYATTSVADDTKILSHIIHQHRVARESIRTLITQYDYERLHPVRSLIASGLYTQTPQSIFIIDGREGQQTNHYLVRNGEVRVVSREWAGGQVNHAGYRSSSTPVFSLCDIRLPLLLAGEGPAGAVMPFDELYERAKRTPDVSRVTLDGRECVRVSVAFDVKGFGKDVEINLEVWHDIKRNYLVLRKEYRQVGGNLKKEFQVTDFFEDPSSGVIVPVKSSIKAYVESELSDEWAISLRSTRLNTDVAEKSLVLPTIPRGMLIHDSIAGQQYKIDSKWNRIGPAAQRPTLIVDLQRTASESNDLPSQSEPTSYALWMVVGSIGLCIVAFVLIIVRYYRRSHAAGQA